MKDAGKYTISIALTEEGKKYYQDADHVSAEFEVLPALIKALSMEKKTSV